MPPAMLGRRIAETPIAVIDFETTGLSPGHDRVLEVSIVRVDPGQAPRHVLDSLVKPNRRVTGTEIHALTDADVADAPTFPELASDILMATSGCVLAAYNASIDLGFLQYEMSQLGVRPALPYLCLMYMQPLLGLGDRCASVSPVSDSESLSPASTTPPKTAGPPHSSSIVMPHRCASKASTPSDNCARARPTSFLKAWRKIPRSGRWLRAISGTKAQRASAAPEKRRA